MNLRKDHYRSGRKTAQDKHGDRLCPGRYGEANKRTERKESEGARDVVLRRPAPTHTRTPCHWHASWGVRRDVMNGNGNLRCET